jgi:hypothetical protein
MSTSDPENVMTVMWRRIVDDQSDEHSEDTMRIWGWKAFPDDPRNRVNVNRVFPFMEDGTFHYVSGMYTALLPLLPASYGLQVTLREIRAARSKAPLIQPETTQPST